MPWTIPYDILAGGACRNTLIDKPINDYDLFYFNKEKYLDAMRSLQKGGFELVEMKSCYLLNEEKNNMVKNNSLLLKMERKDKGIKYDMILYDCGLNRLLKIINNNFDFKANCCYQSCSGSIIVENDALEQIKNRVMELNSETVPLVRLIKRYKIL